ncbi:MAG TPA: hypothetical protein VKW06_21960 [Candidatus Angelobacter sp.]|nr:hypothetical protein [Candidatus Angelobacter sp.]
MDWKKGLIYGSFAAGAILFITGRRPAGMAVAGLGLATLIAEHPDKFEDLWHRMPDYIDKGGRLLDRAASLIELLGQEGRAGVRNIASR